MYRQILVPLDGSSFSEHALPLALSLARRHRAALQVVRVRVPVAEIYSELGAASDGTVDRELMEGERAYLDAIVERLAAVAGDTLSGALLEGPVADAISRHAAATGADLLVMTPTGVAPWPASGSGARPTRSSG